MKVSKVIKLENLVDVGYDQKSGRCSLVETVDYVCGACRHLVNITDKFCWQCGVKLEQSDLVEHYSQGKQLTNMEFKERRKLCH